MFSRRTDHLTLKYVYNRTMVMIDEFKNPNHPWLTRDATKLLDTLIQPTDIGVEFGSGRSTIWFAERLKSLVSIESDEVWFAKISDMLKEKQLDSKIDYRLVENLTDYPLQGKAFADNSIDFCLVDGERRDECAMVMLNKVRPGGLLVIDNINWFLPNPEFCSPDSVPVGHYSTELWKEFDLSTQSYRRIWTSNGVNDTCIFFKA